jgi:hypothetical protein
LLPKDDAEAEQHQSLELKAAAKGDPPANPWTVLAYNKRALKDWEKLVRDTEQNAVNAFDWLVRHPMERMPGRCFPLKYSKHAGNWCYEIGAGDRLYYKPDEGTRTVTVWYAGRHPKDKIPAPPEAL